MTRSARAAGLVIAACLAGCSLPIPRANEPIVPVLYDFGPSRAAAGRNGTIAAAISVPAATSPEWLGEGIVYRLLYRDDAQPQVYTRSRWTVEPASLLTDRLRSRLAGAARAVVSPLDSARSDYTLRVELTDFSQSFDAPSTSRVTLAARASLIRTGDRSVLAQRSFEVKRDAQPDAEGAVRALTDATDAFLDELVDWTVRSVPTKP